jgi:hypothetical protein
MTGLRTGRGSRIKGIARLRKKLKALPDAVAIELAQNMEAVGDQMVAAMRARVRVRTGLVRSLIRRSKVTPRSLRLRAGLLGQRGQTDGFYQLFYEIGHRAKRVFVTRRNRGAQRFFGVGPTRRAKFGGNVHEYYIRVKARAAEYPIRGALGGKRQIGKLIIKDLVAAAFRRAAGVAGGTSE